MDRYSSGNRRSRHRTPEELRAIGERAGFVHVGAVAEQVLARAFARRGPRVVDESYLRALAEAAARRPRRVHRRVAER